MLPSGTEWGDRRSIGESSDHLETCVAVVSVETRYADVKVWFMNYPG